MQIVTHYDPPPTPLRFMDWTAYDADTYDADCDQDGFSRSPVGYGATEAEALADLQSQLEA